MLVAKKCFNIIMSILSGQQEAETNYTTIAALCKMPTCLFCKVNVYGLLIQPRLNP